MLQILYQYLHFNNNINKYIEIINKVKLLIVKNYFTFFCVFILLI